MCECGHSRVWHGRGGWCHGCYCHAYRPGAGDIRVPSNRLALTILGLPPYKPGQPLERE